VHAEAPQSRRRPQRGFSLLEIIIVCAVLVVVAGMAVPRFIVVERQREEKAIIEVEDLLRMFAFRNAVGTQQLGLHYDKPSGLVSLWILDLNPKDPDGPRVWQQDRLSPVVELPESMIIESASTDDIEVRDDVWTITSNPDGSRPRIEVSVTGRETSGIVILENYSSVPVRADKDGKNMRVPIDLDREGRALDPW
jgi:prepilin-type N-terminal cleavage/methylation domain-containing protein